ncbi:RodZ domain-containing protein [Methyloversatilis thermotolerans]|uniref:RodZ domain-containing protein n=1 Tax=Methyloversatilis thermotolerans TaxID=1346290 RepID=UPI00036ACAFC|nr:RodZ domain-containing protein [Methyloversatilis thermotolerans]
MTMDEVATEQTVLASVGGVLRQAREARGMSVASVGAAIKLSPRQVQAIEDDAYDRLLNPTYARGFIRNYASLMGLDPQALLEQLDIQHVTPSPLLVERRDTGVAMPMQSPRRRWMLPLVALSVPVIAAVGLYVWFEYWPQTVPGEEMSDRAVEVNPAGMQTQGPPVDESGAVQADAFASPDSDPGTPLESAPAETEPVVIASGQESPRAMQAPATGQHQLSFAFSQDSWVEIRDAQDRIVVSDLNRGGSSRQINVAYPVSIVVGNARSVKLEVDGAPYDLSPSTKVDVARLRLE